MIFFIYGGKQKEEMMELDVECLRADRTIEKVVKNNRILWIYNNQGLYFDVFFSEKKLKRFFDGKECRGDFFFDEESELNHWLLK